MDTNAKVVPIGVSPVVAVSETTPSSQDFNRDQAAKEAEQASRYRLVIEEGPAKGTFIYKTLDSMTGKVVRQFPREQVLRMAENGGYAAGKLIDTSA